MITASVGMIGLVLWCSCMFRLFQM